MPERALVRRRIRHLQDVTDIEAHTPEDLRPADTVLECLRAAATEQPDKRAIVLVEAPDVVAPARELTYSQLVADVESTASLFHDMAEGASRSVVGLMLPMVPEGLVAMWGAVCAGVAVPLNPFLEPASVVRILAQAGATVLVTTRDMLDAKGGVEAVRAQVPTLRRVFYVDDVNPDHDLMSVAGRYVGDRLDFIADDDPWRDSIAMPTGGTTGTPKLVRMSQAGQLAVAWNVGALMGNEPDTVTAHGMPNFHCGGTISLGLRTVLFGGTLLTLTREGFRSRAALAMFWDAARHYRVTTLLATPTTALALLAGGGDAAGCCIRDFHVGGSALPTDLVERFHARFGIWLRENWGMTELHGTTTGHFNDGSRPRVGSAGRALPHVRVKAVELDETGQWIRDCTPGERGTLLTAAPTVMTGYVDSALDADYFPAGLPDDMSPGWRWGNTGDVGCVDAEGYVWIAGRSKDLIIRGGHNIDPKEIEDVLLSHPTVHLAAAVGRPDPTRGELPIAYVQLHEGASSDPAELIEHCRAGVGERAATPVEVVLLTEMPLTAVGKIAKPALRKDALLREVRRVIDHVEPRANVEFDESDRDGRTIIRLPDARKKPEVERMLLDYLFRSVVVVQGAPTTTAQRSSIASS